MTLLDDDRLLDRIYEAAIVHGRWADVLQTIADRVGAGGGVFRSGMPGRMDWLASPAAAPGLELFIAEGWAADGEYAAPFVAERHPGFRTETDYRTVEELAALPVYRRHLLPRGAVAGAGTIVQCAADHYAILTIEGFPSHAAARRAIPALDALRPHLARAMTVAALRVDTARIVTDSLALAGVAAALIDEGGRRRAANSLFEARMGDAIVFGGTGLRFRDRGVQGRFDAAMARRRDDPRGAQTVAVHDADRLLSFAIHLLPIRGAARDACDGDGVLLLIADPHNRSVPGADLLRLLFDLSPAEARLARHLVDGGTVADGAAAFAISPHTARTQLRSIFLKTGTTRQADLIRLLIGFDPAAR